MEILTPLSGDPDALIQAARGQQDVARAIESAAQALRLIATGELGVSEAVDALGVKSSEIATLIMRAQVRFSDTSDALNVYAHKLKSAQHRADAARARYNEAEDHHSTAQRHRSTVDDQTARSDPADPSLPDLIIRGLKIAEQAAEFARDATAAFADYGVAAAEKEAAALEAIGRITVAADKSGLNDSLFDYLAAGWDAFMQWVRDNSEFLAMLDDVLAAIGQWASFLSTIFSLLALIPGLGIVFGPLALATKIIAIAATVLALVITILLVISGSGRKSIGDLIGQAIGAAVTCIPIPFGGAAAGTAVRAAMQVTAGRTVSRISGEVVTIVIDEVGSASSEYVGELIGSTADAIVNVSSPDTANSCPSERPAPLITPLSPRDPLTPPTILDVVRPVRLNPEYVASIGCKEASN